MDTEEPIEPDLVICDPHHHLLNVGGLRYMGEELQADASSGHRVTSTVFIECGSGYHQSGPEHLQPVGETELVVEVDPRGDIVAGIVGFTDLCSAQVEEALAAHIEAAAGRFRGIRHITAFDPSPNIPWSSSSPSPNLLASPDFRRGVKALGRAGLSYDAWLYHHQLAELTDLARAHPDLVIIQDHLGGPLGIAPYDGRRDEVMEQWRAGMRDLAACPNVFLKLGGVGMPIFGQTWHHRPELTTSETIAAAWGEPIRWCIEEFGADRCMFESNFPVDKSSCSYLVLWNAFKRIVADASAAEKAALFHDTAVKTYRL